jgi:hypothetical protein
LPLIWRDSCVTIDATGRAAGLRSQFGSPPQRDLVEAITGRDDRLLLVSSAPTKQCVDRRAFLPGFGSLCCLNLLEVEMGKDKQVTIIVNGTQKSVAKDDLTYDEVVYLAFESPPYGENTLFTITYRRGQGNKPEEILAPGETVKVKEGMIFDVTATDKS